MIYTIYTDGATSNNGYENAVGGAAFVILNDKEEIIEQKSFTIENATNNICELIAIIEACKTIDRLLNTTDKAIVCSDSAYCINCYKQAWWRSWRNNGWKNSKKSLLRIKNFGKS